MIIGTTIAKAGGMALGMNLAYHACPNFLIGFCVTVGVLIVAAFIISPFIKD